MKKRKKKSDNVPKILGTKSDSDCLTVKTSLKSVLKDYQTNFPIINQLVIDAQEIVVRTYLFIRLYLLYKYKLNQAIPEINTQFILYCIRTLGVRDNRGRQSKDQKLLTELSDFYDKQFQPYLGKPKFSLVNKTYLIPYLAIQIQTGFNNNLKEHFITRIRRFMNIFQPTELFSKELNEKEHKRLFLKVKNSILLDKIEEKCPKEFQEWAKGIREKHLPKTYEKSFSYDAKCNPSKYLPFTIKMNELIEKRNEKLDSQISKTDDEELQKSLQTEKKKLFQPIPLRTSVVPGYITIDTNVILSTFGGKGEKQLNKKTKKYFRHIWLKVFNIDNKVFNKKGYHFTSVQTDGIGLSIIFEKDGIKRKNTKKNVQMENIKTDTYLDELGDDELKVIKQRKIVSVDPGKQKLVEMLDESGNNLRYTASQRRMESLAKRNKNIIWREKAKLKIQEMESELSSQNSKTVDYQKFQQYIKDKIALNDKIKDFYQQELLRKLKWRTHIYRRKSEDKFLNNMESTFGKKEEVIICYGDWSNNKQMKHIMPTMGKGMRKLVAKRFDLALVNEYKSSQLCHHCYGKLENWQGKHRVLVCHGCCGSESKKSVFVNRDMNACYNLVTISKDWIESKFRRSVFSCKSDNDLT